MTRASATLLVCTVCRKITDEASGTYEEPGKILVDILAERLADSGVTVQPVQCLSVCKRPCTVALQQPGKWTYIVGDLDRDVHVDDIVDAATKFAASADGIVPWRDRPLTFRKGTIARIPPLPGAAVPETSS